MSQEYLGRDVLIHTLSFFVCEIASAVDIAQALKGKSTNENVHVSHVDLTDLLPG